MLVNLCNVNVMATDATWCDRRTVWFLGPVRQAHVLASGAGATGALRWPPGPGNCHYSYYTDTHCDMWVASGAIACGSVLPELGIGQEGNAVACDALRR